MKTNIKKYSTLIIAFAIMAVSSIAYASYGSSGTQNDCPRPGGSGTISCVDFHNNGYTGANGQGGDFPRGTSFATFNGYKDQKTQDGRRFDERQFVYIESELAQYPGRPYPSPWENESNYNFAQGTSYTINFNGTESQKIGVWGYLHNNGVQDEYPSYNTTIRFSGWSENTPQLQHNPRLTITGSNTRPTSVWADVTIDGSQPFTLKATEAYIIREAADGRPGVAPIQLGEDHIQTVVSTGTKINSNPTYSGGRFDSSHIHYVKVYLEFEAVPADVPGVCRSLTITDPSENLLTVNEDGFNDRNLSFTVDADQGVVNGYRVLSTRGTVTFDNTGQSNIQTTKTSLPMDGGPTPTNQTETVQVWALDQNGNGIQSCWDSFAVRIEQEENDCAVLETTPPPSPVPLNEETTITVDELLDTNGDLYTDEGNPAQIEYCYSNNDITFNPEPGLIWFHIPPGRRCIVTQYSEDYNVRVYPTSPGTMSMNVVGTSPDVCYSEFETKGEEIEGICLDLSFLPSYEAFDLTQEEEYCVTLEVEEEARAAYNDNIRWTVQRDGNVVFTQETRNILCLDFDNYPSFSYRPGDTLVAQAVGIDDPGDDCVDRLTSEDTECTRFELNRDTFERGTNQEVCIDYTDWPLNPGDSLEYSVDGGATQSVNLYRESGDLCFILTNNMVANADIVRVWVPGWEEECNHELTHEVEPPKFNKNAKSSDASAYTSRTVANFSDTYVNYRLTYTHYNDESQDVTITDTIGTDRYIQGYIASVTTQINTNTPEGGRIYYNEGSMRVFVGGESVETCNDTETEICYERNIGSANGVLVRNVTPRSEVLIEYRGEIRDSSVNPENCSDPDHVLNTTEVCGEVYPNIGRFTDEMNYRGSDGAEVIIPCPFIIIRSGGEVFFENPFDYGVDTLMCAEIRNVDTPVIIGVPPDDRRLIKTGEDSSVLREYNDRLCKSDAAGYEPIAGISSLICELQLTSEELTQQAIVQSLSRNIQLFARYSRNLNNTSVIDGSSNLTRSSNDVYIKDNGMLTLGGEFADRSRTIVVLNNDVYINKDLTFKDPTTLDDPRKVPSLAVIVIGGNIVIDPSVKETQAIFFVQEGAKSEGGQICEAPKTGSAKPADFCVDDTSLVNYNSKERLTHYGSIYGDIQHLLKYRVKTGDPTKEEGAILIRFDNRVYLNTPPLLNRLVDVSQRSF